MAADIHTRGAPDRAPVSCTDTARLLQSTLYRLEAVLVATDIAVERLERHQPVQEQLIRDRGRLTSLVEVCSELIEQAQSYADTIENLATSKLERH